MNNSHHSDLSILWMIALLVLACIASVGSAAAINNKWPAARSHINCGKHHVLTHAGRCRQKFRYER
jgi:hypothetical protein